MSLSGVGVPLQDAGAKCLVPYAGMIPIRFSGSRVLKRIGAISASDETSLAPRQAVAIVGTGQIPCRWRGAASAALCFGPRQDNAVFTRLYKLS